MNREAQRHQLEEIRAAYTESEDRWREVSNQESVRFDKLTEQRVAAEKCWRERTESSAEDSGTFKSLMDVCISALADLEGLYRFRNDVMFPLWDELTVNKVENPEITIPIFERLRDASIERSEEDIPKLIVFMGNYEIAVQRLSAFTNQRDVWRRKIWGRR